MTAPITRFAPSPTGHLHIGGARTALFCWAYARLRGGRFVVRIEDTDQARSSEAAAAGILEDLAWLGIDWDDGPVAAIGSRTCGGDSRSVGPYFQAQRLETYNRYIERLLSTGSAYPAFETGTELAAMRAAAQAQKQTFCYRQPAGFGRDRALAEMRRRDAAGEPYVVRFRMPHEPVRVVDTVLGEIEFSEQHLDDFIIRKADGFPTYHLAVVVDDELMGVTHVLRGQEHLINTPRHVALQRALGLSVPVYAHLPLIFNPDGSKMSKRDKAKAAREHLRRRMQDHDQSLDDLSAELDWPAHDLGAFLRKESDSLEIARRAAERMHLDLPEIDVHDFRRSGYLPEVLCNYIALLGWNPGLKNDDGSDLERFDNEFLAAHFSFERIGKGNARFDREKLRAFNAATIAAMPPEEFAHRWEHWLKHEQAIPGSPRILLDLLADSARRLALARAVQPRAKTFADAVNTVDFLAGPDDGIRFDEAAVAKVLRKGDPAGLELVRQFAGELDAIEPFDEPTIHAAISTFCAERGIGMGKIAQPLRVALTGGTVSPPIDATVALLGRDRVRTRLERCLRHNA